MTSTFYFCVKRMNIKNILWIFSKKSRNKNRNKKEKEERITVSVLKVSCKHVRFHLIQFSFLMANARSLKLNTSYYIFGQYFLISNYVTKNDFKYFCDNDNLLNFKFLFSLILFVWNIYELKVCINWIFGFFNYLLFVIYLFTYDPHFYYLICFYIIPIISIPYIW